MMFAKMLDQVFCKTPVKAYTKSKLNENSHIVIGKSQSILTDLHHFTESEVYYLLINIFQLNYYLLHVFSIIHEIT